MAAEEDQVLLPDLAKQGKAGLFVFGDFVTFRQRVQNALLGFTGKEVKGDLLAAF